MDDCIHGIDVRNPCRACEAVIDLGAIDRKHFIARAEATLRTLGLALDPLRTNILLGELALAFCRGMDRGVR
jgi:hypothetical protein